MCETLKSDIRTSHIPVILLTAKADVDSKLTGLSSGADAYLVKPFNRDELLIQLQKALELRERLRERYSTLSVPDESSNTHVSREDAFIRQIRAAIINDLDNAELNTGALSAVCAISERQLQLKIKALTGKTPALLIRAMRLKRAQELLKNPDLRVNEIAYDVGFTDPAYFTRAFTKEFGNSPSAWRKQWMRSAGS